MASRMLRGVIEGRLICVEGVHILSGSIFRESRSFADARVVFQRHRPQNCDRAISTEKHGDKTIRYAATGG